MQVRACVELFCEHPAALKPAIPGIGSSPAVTRRLEAEHSAPWCATCASNNNYCFKLQSRRGLLVAWAESA